MKVKFIEDKLPSNYSTPAPASGLESTKQHGGKEYRLLGLSEKGYALSQRLLRGICALAKTILTLGIALIFEKTRVGWKAFFTGKKMVVMYSTPAMAMKILADKGDAEAQFKLAKMYAKGDGVSKSDEEAVRLYRASANQGHLAALNNLGGMFWQGRGVKQSNEEAFECFKSAAYQDCAVAQYNLAEMYYAGCYGVAPSDDKAIKWFSKAAAGGHAPAQKRLNEIQSNTR